MQKFEYRTPRYTVDLPVVFKLEKSIVAGRCREIGKEGMKVAFQEPVSAGASGTICIAYKELSLELPASIAHAEADSKGLKFLFESDKDRIAVERLVMLLSGTAGPTGPTLVR